MTRLRFDAGTLVVDDVHDASLLPDSCRWDERAACHRAPAAAYHDVVMALVRGKVEYEDVARSYAVVEGLRVRREPRPFQSEALEAWLARPHRGRGVVVLPTGAGKTYVAMLALDAVRRSTLVVAPTLDLVRQWRDNLRGSFGQPVGAIGGGEYDVQSLTVTTYDSAYLHMENLGNRFGLVVFDECHHLPGEAYAFAARACLAPYRLGLTATPERVDGRHTELDELVGPCVYRRDVVELAGDYLAEYRTERVVVELTSEERAEYDHQRSIYRSFVMRMGIRMSRPDGWQQFVQRSARSAEGRAAMQAYLAQKRLAFSAPSKLEYVDYLLDLHRRDLVLLFTQSNDTAYAVSRRFLVPIITHQTKLAERTAILGGFANGTYGAVATSKVLNEGVDVPDANVAIVISGERLGAGARPAAGPGPAQAWGQAGGALRTRRRRHRRDVHLRPSPRARCLPLTWCASGARVRGRCTCARSTRRRGIGWWRWPGPMSRRPRRGWGTLGGRSSMLARPFRSTTRTARWQRGC